MAKKKTHTEPQPEPQPEEVASEPTSDGAKKPNERGFKAQETRRVLEQNPEAGPSELANLLNETAQREGWELTWTATEISTAKSKLNKSPASKPAPKTRETEKVWSNDGLTELRALARKVGGFQKLKELCEMLMALER